MYSTDKQILTRVVESYVRTGSIKDEHVKVTLLPDNKTSHVEQTGEEGRTVLLDKFIVDGKIVWAGYSARTTTVYLSAVTGY